MSVVGLCSSPKMQEKWWPLIFATIKAIGLQTKLFAMIKQRGHLIVDEKGMNEYDWLELGQHHPQYQFNYTLTLFDRLLLFREATLEETFKDWMALLDVGEYKATEAATSTTSVDQRADELKVHEELRAVYNNLDAVQKRCTEQALEIRDLKAQLMLVVPRKFPDVVKF